MKIRKYQSIDCSALTKLFYDTVHTINAKDYSQAQLDVWATSNIDISKWDKSFSKHNTLVAEENGIIVGFGDMYDDGYLDRLYVHKEYQGKGIATRILDMLEKESDIQKIKQLSTHASITSKPFFEKHGYEVICTNTVIRDGIELTNFLTEGKVNHIVDLDQGIIIIKDVPANVCKQCGEYYLGTPIALVLESIVEEVKKSRSEVIIMRW